MPFDMHPRSLFTSIVCATQILARSQEPGLTYGDQGEVSAELIFDDTPFIAVHSAPANETFLLICDFGEVSQVQSEAVYRDALHFNLLSIESDRGTFCLESDTNHLLLVTKGRLASVDVDCLTQAMKRIAAHATAWREQLAPGTSSLRALSPEALSCLA